MEKILYNLISEPQKKKTITYNFVSGADTDDEEMSQQKTLKTEPVDIMDADFIGLIVGRQGYGKSTLISKLLTTEKLLKRKFNFILWNTPSKIPGFKRDEEFWNDKIDLLWLKDRLERISNTCEEKNKEAHVLWVIDDSIAQIFGGKSSADFLDLIIRRRHIFPRVNISIIFTAQYYKLFPKKYRSMLNYIWIYELMGDDVNDIFKEIFGNLKSNGKSTVIQSHWQSNKHNFIFINLLKHIFTLNHHTVFRMQEL